MEKFSYYMLHVSSLMYTV